MHYMQCTSDGCAMILLLGNTDVVTQDLDRVSDEQYYGCILIHNTPPGVYRIIATDTDGYISNGPVAVNITTIVVLSATTEKTSTVASISISIIQDPGIILECCCT